MEEEFVAGGSGLYRHVSANRGSIREERELGGLYVEQAYSIGLS